ncbi:MAG: OmpA family protein, partial [bacterium]
FLGESAYGAGDYERAQKAFQTAYSLDPINSDARAGLQRTERTLNRRSLLQKQASEFVWDVGLRSRINPLTLIDDNLEFENDALGSPFFGSDGKLSFTSGDGGRFQIYTLSADGLHLTRRAASSSGFSGILGPSNQFLVALGVGPGREVGAYDDSRGTFKSFYRGHCKEPNYSGKARLIVCLTPQGVLIVDSVSDNVSTLSREAGARYPRFSRDGKMVVLAVGDELVLHDLAGQVIQRIRLPGGEEATRYPDISPDGRWIVSGRKGIYLTSIKDKFSIPLRHPYLQNGSRSIFSADGHSVVFERGGRLYLLSLPKPVGSFFAFQRVKAMIQEKRFGAAVRLLNGRKSKDQNFTGYFLLLGQAYMGLEFNEKAKIAAGRAARLGLKDWRPQLLLGKLMAARRAWERAAQFLDRAVELGPDQFEGYLERAKIRSRQGNIDAAIQDYRTALEKLGPNPGPKGESTVFGLFNEYVDSKRVNDALLLLLDHADRLSANTLELVRKSSRYHIIRKDPRFNEVIGPVKPMPARSEPGRPGTVPDTFPAKANPSFRSNERSIKSGKIQPTPMARRPRLVAARKESDLSAKGSKLKMNAPWVLNGVLFDFDKSTIKPRFYSILDRAVAVLKKNSVLHVEIQGYTDERGPAGYNQRLSKERAMAVMRYFVQKGVRGERLSARGFGETNPVASNATEADRAKNRRVELKAKETGIFAAR